MKMKCFAMMVAMLVLVGWLPVVLADGVTIQPVTIEEQARYQATHVVVVTAADLLTTTATNTAQTNVLFTAPAGSLVSMPVMFLDTAWEDASDAAFNSLSIVIGDADVDEYLESLQICVNGTEVLSSVGTGVTGYYATATAVNLIVTPSPASKKLSDVDTGVLRIYFRILDR